MTCAEALKVFIAAALVLVPAARAADQTCVTCHPSEAAQFSESAHARAQLSCQDCHGGAVSYDVPQPVSGAFDHGPGFLGKANRLEIPEKCGSCHSDVARMNPYGLPANQLARYRTSGHGVAIFEGRNEAAAVCTDCHDVHAIFKSSDSRSWTHPLNVPEMCARCHADAALMADYDHDPGLVAEYENSVHGQGLLVDRDTAMPTCATCHGNHAATPPGVSSVNAVCGRCHMQAEQYFLESPHAEVASFPRCIACHGGDHGHAVARLTVLPRHLVKAYAGVASDLEGAALIDRLHPGLAQVRETCYACHDEDSDDSSDVAAFVLSENLNSTIREAELTYAKVAHRVDEAGRGILLVENEELMLGDARTAVIELGTTQHSLDHDAVQDVATRVMETAALVQASIDAKEQGLAWRYQVLTPMWLFIAVFGIASYIKYRRLRKQFVKPHAFGTGGSNG